MSDQTADGRNIALPLPTPPSFNYVPVVLHGGTAYVSGQIAKVDGAPRVFGKVGGAVDLETARAEARICALQALAQLKAALGSLDRVERVLKLTGFVASAPGFGRQPSVIDGASELMIEVFGEAGRHARSAIGVAELPLDVPVEIEMIVAVHD